MFSKVYRLQRAQVLPITRAECWDFFSTPKNLPRITPPWLGFETGDLPDEVVRPGHIFQYQVRPILSIPLTWVTEITHLVEPDMFVDEQRFGPYRFWHHQHHFKTISGGVEMMDLIHYQLPLGWLGPFLNRFKVQQDLNLIFNYREKKLIERFGEL